MTSMTTMTMTMMTRNFSCCNQWTQWHKPCHTSSSSKIEDVTHSRYLVVVCHFWNICLGPDDHGHCRCYCCDCCCCCDCSWRHVRTHSRVLRWHGDCQVGPRMHDVDSVKWSIALVYWYLSLHQVVGIGNCRGRKFVCEIVCFYFLVLFENCSEYSVLYSTRSTCFY